MWTFTKDGFFSVTLNKREDDDTLMVRARVKDDLTKLIKRLNAKYDTEMLGVEIIETPRADYRYRVILPRWAWAHYLVLMADDLDYTNVKNTLAPLKTEAKRHSAMMGCWTAMARLQPGGAYGGRHRSVLLPPSWEMEELPSWDDEEDDEDDYCDICDWFHSPNEACEMIGG